MLPLVCAVQQYAWGRLGSESTVARLASTQGVEVHADEHYAELWMGTHASGPSRLEDGRLLSAEVGALPFLFKVLSVNKALSIQAHPDKPLAERLHAARPDIYRDPNHKPEMAIALTEFEALCGFRPREEIDAHLAAYPELRALTGASEGRELRALFEAFATAPEAAQQAQVAALVARLQAEPEPSDLQRLLLRLQGQFPGDVGVFCPLLLNVLTLQPGQAVFLAANEPHAYLSGDCAECMACSDNVVRAGLTPKLRDVPTLVDMLTYRCWSPDDLRLAGDRIDEHLCLYRPPAGSGVDEFEVLTLALPAEGVSAYELPPPHSTGVLLVVEGEGTLNGAPVRGGSVFAVTAGSPLSLVPAAGSAMQVLVAQGGSA